MLRRSFPDSDTTYRHTPGTAVAAGDWVQAYGGLMYAPNAIAANTEGLLYDLGEYDVTVPTGDVIAIGDVLNFETTGSVFQLGAGDLNAVAIAKTASASGSVTCHVQLLPTKQRGVAGVEAHTAADTLTVAESGSGHTNTGASGAVTLTLPAATVGLEYYFMVGAAQELRLDPDGTETISLPSSGVAGAAGKYLTANAAGESVHIVCMVAGSWAVFGFTGTWTAEA